MYSAEEVGIETELKIGDASLPEKVKAENEKTSLRLLCSDQVTRYELSPTLFYANKTSQQADFSSGPRSVLTAALTNLQIVKEEDLSWEQVEEFRRDDSARQKYRRLVRWIDRELECNDCAAIEDMIAIRLDDYEWALKKHGLKASLGSLSSVIDPKFLSATSVAVGGITLAAGEIWGLFVGTSIVIGKVAAEFATMKIDGEDERREKNFEIAYVHEVKKALNQR